MCSRLLTPVGARATGELGSSNEGPPFAVRELTRMRTTLPTALGALVLVVTSVRAALLRAARLHEQSHEEQVYRSQDHLGSVRELVDSSGKVRAAYRYSVYGRRSKVAGDLEADWGFAGLWHHEASGLELATYRAYDATRGRWLSRDPIGEAGGLNLLAYCGGDPINHADPMGLETVVILGHSTGGRGAFGHIAVAIPGFSQVYSYGHQIAPNVAITDYLQNQINKRDQTILVINTTPEQEIEIGSRLGSYYGQDTCFPFDTCATRSLYGLGGAGAPPLGVGPHIVTPADVAATARVLSERSFGEAKVLTVTQGTSISGVVEWLRQFRPKPTQSCPGSGEGTGGPRSDPYASFQGPR